MDYLIGWKQTFSSLVPETFAYFTEPKSLTQTISNLAKLPSSYLQTETPPVQQENKPKESLEEWQIVTNENIETVPDFYVPFVMEKNQVKKIVRAWLFSYWFSPSDLISTATLGKCRAIYVPVYSFSFRAKTDYYAEVLVGTNEWKKVQGTYYSLYDQIVYPASSSTNFELLKSLLVESNFCTEVGKVLPSKPNKYIPQTLNQEILVIDIDDKQAWNSKKHDINQKEVQASTKKISSQNHTSKVLNASFFTDYLDFKSSIVLLPLYSVEYEYAGNCFEILVSGVNGKLGGNKPFGTGIMGKICVDTYQKINSFM